MNASAFKPVLACRDTQMHVPEQAIVIQVTEAQSASEQVEDLVRQHASFVYQVAYAILRSPQEAEDVVQETFIRVWKHAGEISTISSQRGWLARIAWRVAIDWRKKHRNPAMVHDGDLPEPCSTEGPVDEELIRTQQARLLGSLIARLPRDLRETLDLSVVAELNSAEIAQILDIPESSVRGRLLRARRLLQEKAQAFLKRKK